MKPKWLWRRQARQVSKFSDLRAENFYKKVHSITHANGRNAGFAYITLYELERLDALGNRRQCIDLLTHYYSLHQRAIMDGIQVEVHAIKLPGTEVKIH